VRIIHYPGGKVIAEVTFLRGSNFHAHFRKDAMMRAVAYHILRYVKYALVMPNTGHILTIEQALDYRRDILDATATMLDRRVVLVMTLYFTELVTPQVIQRIKEVEERTGIRIAVKYYPPAPGATTGSGRGIPLAQGHETLLEMSKLKVPLLGHFEETHDRNGRELPQEEREAYMIANVLWKFRDAYPDLRHCVEHASTKDAVPYVQADPSGNTAMTVTPQHSLFINPDFEELGTELKCMPIVKSPEDRAAIVEFITSGDFRAIAGDDTAPHAHKSKLKPFGEAASGCWLPHSLLLYAEVFDRAHALDARFERFMSLNGPAWWGLPAPDEDDTITLRRVKDRPLPAPVSVPEIDDVIVPLGWSPDGDKLTLSFAVQ
jgi:dihydroorotase